VTTKYLQAALASEYLHLQFLESNGAEPLTVEFYFPQGTFADKKTLGTVTSIAETVFVAAYLAATRRFAELENPLLAATAAQVAVVEGQHLLFMRQLAGEPVSNNIGLGEALFADVSESKEWDRSAGWTWKRLPTSSRAPRQSHRRLARTR
jgi:hypothetical protein